MDDLLKAIGLLLYVILLPLFAFVEAIIRFIVFFNHNVSRLAVVTARRKKHVVALLKHRLHFPWFVKQAGHIH